MLVVSAYPAGQAPLASIQAAERTMHQLRKALSLRNTLHCNVVEYAQILDEMLKHLPIMYGPEGLILWLAEVQHYTRLLRCRTLDGNVLNKNERDHIEMYVTYWRQRRGGSLCMGRPEAQIVLLSLRDFVQTYHATFDMRIHPSHMKQSPPHQ